MPTTIEDAQEESRQELILTDRWKPLRPHPGQALFWHHPARFKENAAPRRAGKTEIAKRDATLQLAILGNDGNPQKIGIGAPTYTRCKELYFDDLRALIPKHWLKKVKESLSQMEFVTHWGSSIRLLGLDRPQVVEGVPWHRFYSDETPDTPPNWIKRHLRPALATAGIEGGAWFYGVPDECFIAGTMVDTPEGARAIEEIREGDLVCNAVGVGRVTRTSVRQKSEILVVRASGRILKSSLRHPYLTRRRGWVAACELEVGDELVSHYEAMRAVWSGVSGPAGTKYGKAKILRECLPVWLRGGCATQAQPALREMWKDVSREAAESAFLRETLLREILCTNEPRTHDATGARSRCLHCETKRISPHENGSGPIAVESKAKRNRAQAPISRRKWDRNDNSAEDAIRCNEGIIGCRASGSLRNESRRTTSLLQGGFGRTKIETCYRDRRRIPQFTLTPKTGSAQGSGADFARVESIEIHQSGSAEFAEISGGKDTVSLYDLTVSGHPSFCVEGLVVHNCGPNQAEYEELWEQGLRWPETNHCSFWWPASDILSPEEFEAVSADMDELTFRQEMLGQFVRSGNKAVPQFDPKIHVDAHYAEYCPYLPICHSFDFGVRPSVSLVGQRYRNQIWIVDEISLDDGSTDVACREFIARAGANGWALQNGVEVYGDAAGRTPGQGSGKSDYIIIREEYGGRFPLVFRNLVANPGIKDTVNAIRRKMLDRHGRVNVFIHPRCKRLIDDLKKAPWPSNLSEFHALAAFRYLIYALSDIGSMNAGVTAYGKAEITENQRISARYTRSV